MWYAATAVFNENCIALNVNIRRKKVSTQLPQLLPQESRKKKSKLDQTKQNEGEKENKNGE